MPRVRSNLIEFRDIAAAEKHTHRALTKHSTLSHDTCRVLRLMERGYVHLSSGGSPDAPSTGSIANSEQESGPHLYFLENVEVVLKLNDIAFEIYTYRGWIT